MTGHDGRKPSARERLLVAADELFFADGIQSVGIDRVIDRAGVAKASLYRAFDGKDDLVAAYLDARHDANIQQLRAAAETCQEPRERLLMVFNVQSRWISAPGYRGCPFTRASAEVDVDGVVRAAVDSYRHDVRRLFTELSDDVGAPDSPGLARQLEIVFHGAAVLVGSEPADVLTAAQRAAAASLVDAATQTTT